MHHQAYHSIQDSVYKVFQLAHYAVLFHHLYLAGINGKALEAH